MEREAGSFVWDTEKEYLNIKKHGVNFVTAARAFKDPDRKIYIDSRHNKEEERFFCLGKVMGRVLTARFTYRGDKIRIFGAGYWRKGETYYEREDGKPK